MYLIQILLPVTDNAGTPFPRSTFDQVRTELTERFGGLTAYVRSPATGLWKDQGETVSDDVVIHEVMAETLDRAWWQDYREELLARFRQESLIVRASAVELL